MSRTFRILLPLLLLLATVSAASAQQLPQRRSARQMVRGGLMQRPDTLVRPSGPDSLLSGQLIDSLKALAADSLTLDSLLQTARREAALAAAARGVDSLALAGAGIDTLLTEAADTLLAPSLLDSLARADSLMQARMADTVKRRGWLMSDSMSLSKVCWASLVLPGYGQIYNKQYWKLPILYGTVGAGIGLFVHENNKYKPLKRRYDELTLTSTERTPELDALQASMIRHNTRRQVYLFASVASYLYFIGDAAVNYRTNDVSNVKKATTLACICPGAGQIYNQSYWKVPFVVGGFAAMIYCIDWNNRGYQRFKKAYSLRAAYDQALNDYNADPENIPRPEGSMDEFRGRYSASFLKNLRDNYRRNRDLCIIITAGIYVLQIVDAHVDAHLKDYDISDDLSMSLEPKIDYTYVPTAGGHRPVYGFNLSVNF